MKGLSMRMSVIILSIIILSAVAAPYIAPYSPEAQDIAHALEGPSTAHPLGTDELGRDVLSRLIYGARITLSVAFFSSLLAVFAGTLVGLAAGLGGRAVDNAVMRIVDFFYSIPDLLLIVLITVMAGRSVGSIIFAIGVTSWASVSRMVRNEVISLKTADFFAAARAEGQSLVRTVFFHIVPNLAGVILVVLSLRVPAAVIAESSLSFLGLGLNPPAASWGVLCQSGFRGMAFYPHLIFPPAVAIFMTVYLFNILADLFSEQVKPWSTSRS